MCLGTIGVVTRIADDDGIPMALVRPEAAGAVHACLLTCPEAAVGDTVLVHSGYVLQILDPSPPRDGQDRRGRELPRGVPAPRCHGSDPRRPCAHVRVATACRYARSRENELIAGAVAGYGRRVGSCMVMVRRARLRAVAPGMGLAPAR